MPSSEVRLTLMRHAKSSWQDDALHDHERPLNARGRRDAPRMARRLAALAPPVTHVCCSSAARTRETAGLLTDCLAPDASGDELDTLYLAGDTELWRVATQALASASREDMQRHVLLLAHFPGIQSLSARLCAEVPGHFPTAAYCHLVFDAAALVPLLDAATLPQPEAVSDAALTACAFDYPRRLDD